MHLRALLIYLLISVNIVLLLPNLLCLIFLHMSHVMNDFNVHRFITLSSIPCFFSRLSVLESEHWTRSNFLCILIRPGANYWHKNYLKSHDIQIQSAKVMITIVTDRDVFKVLTSSFLHIIRT